MLVFLIVVYLFLLFLALFFWSLWKRAKNDLWNEQLYSEGLERLNVFLRAENDHLMGIFSKSMDLNNKAFDTTKAMLYASYLAHIEEQEKQPCEEEVAFYEEDSP